MEMIALKMDGMVSVAIVVIVVMVLMYVAKVYSYLYGEYKTTQRNLSASRNRLCRYDRGSLMIGF